MPETQGIPSSLERFQIFQERLMDISSLDALINLACSVLDCSLYICDGQGFILAHSPAEARSCHIFRNIVCNTHQVSKEKLKTLLGPTPLCNVMRDPLCQGETCTRLSFPLKIGRQGLPGAVTFFIWDRTLTNDDQALASMAAGAFSAFMRKHSFAADKAQISQVSLLRELLDYKPGLRSYYERGLAMENMHTLRGGYRLVYISAPQSAFVDANTLTIEIACQIPQSWVFPYNERILLVFNESKISVESVAARLAPLFEVQQLSACLSVQFASLLDLRYVYVDTQACFSIAVRKSPGTRLNRAQDYIALAFLNKCREFFPLEPYYPEGFKRLLHVDQEMGRNYLATLSAYLDNNMSVSAASKAIFMHRNTMRQQLEKIEEILGLSIRDPETCWYLKLSLKIHELLEL